MGKSKYELLNDEGWLRQKYVEEQRSTPEIAKIVGAKGASIVWEALRRFGIPRRSISDAMMLGGDDDHFVFDRSVINGCLLGDGSLRSYSRSDQSIPRFECKHALREHTVYVATLLFSDKPEDRVFEETLYHKQLGRQYTCYILRSLTHAYLKPVIDEWYPEASGYRKVVPGSLRLDATSLLHWFMDDGTVQRNQAGRNICCVFFCSESFSKQDQEMLVGQMNSLFDLQAYLQPYRAGSGWRIRIPSTSVKQFFSIVGPPPIEAVSHKWD